MEIMSDQSCELIEGDEYLVSMKSKARESESLQTKDGFIRSKRWIEN